MMRPASLIVAAVLLAQAATFKSGVDAVSVDVSVRDGSKVVTGLRAADFELFDNGVPQDVADVSFGRLPIDVTLALDVSFSVAGALLERLRQAVRQLMRDLRPGDRLRLIDFNMRVVEVVGYTDEAAAVDAALASAAAGGGSSIRDALAVALVSASEPQRRQLLVVFTDGADSTSITTPEALRDLATRSSASIAAVLPPAPRDPGPQMRQGEALFEALAEDTGGTVVRVRPGMRRTTGPGGRTSITMGGDIADLTETFRKVLDDFRSSYVLHYTPRGVAAGGFHDLEVRIRGRRSVTVRARRGYQR